MVYCFTHSGHKVGSVTWLQRVNIHLGEILMAFVTLQEVTFLYFYTVLDIMCVTAYNRETNHII